RTRTASRTDDRPTPSSVARARSGGRWSPGDNSPDSKRDSMLWSTISHARDADIRAPSVWSDHSIWRVIALQLPWDGALSAALIDDATQGPTRLVRAKALWRRQPRRRVLPLSARNR